MSHPYAGQAKSSQKARLKRLGGTAGKSWGSSSMYKSKTLPKKNAGSSTPMTISGGSAKSRPDRYASGGSVGKKRRPHATTNIIISHAGGRGGSGGGGGSGPNPGGGPVPVPVPRPVPVPVGAGGPPAGPAPMPMRPPLPAGGAPVGAAGLGPMPPRPPLPVGAGGLPPGGAMPPMRPPGMKTGGVIKKAKGGFLEMKEKVPGKTYKGYPRSPTSKVDDAVSAHASGGAVKKRADGGGITLTKKLQLGGGTGGGGGLGQGQAALGQPGGSGLMGVFPGRQPVPAQQGTPNLSGTPMIPAQPTQTAQMPRMGTSVLARPAPGTTSTYAKRGGSIPHGDEKEDRKLFGKMMKEKGISKRKGGGAVNPGSNQTARGLSGSIYRQQGKGFASGGVITNATGGGGGGKARLAKASAARSVPAKTEL